MYANQYILVSNAFLRIKILCDKMKKKISHCRNSSKNSINRDHIHDRSLSWLGTGSLIKSVCVKLYYGSKPHRNIIYSCVQVFSS